jgi:hypothetical protein
MLAARGALATIAVELPVRIQVICFEIAIYTLAPRACGSSARGRFDNNQRGLIFLRDLRRR